MLWPPLSWGDFYKRGGADETSVGARLTLLTRTGTLLVTISWDHPTRQNDARENDTHRNGVLGGKPCAVTLQCVAASPEETWRAQSLCPHSQASAPCRTIQGTTALACSRTGHYRGACRGGHPLSEFQEKTYCFKQETTLLGQVKEYFIDDP